MKIILFGNQGQIGKEITQLAETAEIETIGFDIDNLDVTNEVQVKAVFEKNTADVAINAAAYTAVDKAENEIVQAFKVNCIGVENLAMSCKQYDIPLMHLSTDYVFSGASKHSYAETDEPSPLNVYGQSKLKGERELANIWQKHIILRVSWVFGRYGNNFVKTILKLAKEKESLNVVGDQYGCPTAAVDIARVLLEMAVQINAGKNLWGIYNYCNYPVTNWYDFASKIVEIGRDRHHLKVVELNKIITADYPTKAIRPRNSELLVKKIISDYGIDRYNWFDYLRQVIDEVQL